MTTCTCGPNEGCTNCPPTLHDAKQALLNAIKEAADRGMAADARNYAGAYELLNTNQNNQAQNNQVGSHASALS